MIGFTQIYNSGGGGNQDLQSVLSFGDRTVKIIDADSPLIYDDVFIDFVETDAQEFIFMQLDNFYYLLNNNILQENAEIHLYNSVAIAVAFIQVGANVKVIYNGNSILTDDLINIPVGTTAILKKLLHDRDGNFDVFGLTFESVIYEPAPTPTPSLNLVLNEGDRQFWTSNVFPITNNITLSSQDRGTILSLTNETLANDIAVFINDTGTQTDGEEYKILNASDHKVEIKPSDGINLLGDIFFVPKNSVAIIKALKQQIGLGAPTNNKTFLVTFQSQEKKEFIGKVKSQSAAGLQIDTVKNTTSVQFDFVRTDVGTFSISNFDVIKHNLIATVYNSKAKVEYTAEENLMYTLYDNVNSDSLFEFRGWIKIEEIN